MSTATHRVEMTEYFLDKLARIEQFSNQSGPVAARAFTASIFTFCYEILAAQPWAYPAFRDGEVVRQDIRRAVFRRTHALLYRVTDTSVKLLEIFHTRQGEVGLPAAETDYWALFEGANGQRPSRRLQSRNATVPSAIMPMAAS